MLFIDDQGRLWDGSSLKLRLDLRDPSAAFDFGDHVVRSLGFIALGVRQASYHVRLKPTVVSQVALAALFHKLADDRPARVIVSTADERDIDELCGNWHNATNRISRLVFNAHQNASQAFLSRRMAADRVAGSPLSLLLNRWRETEHRFSPRAFMDILRVQLGGRYVITEVSGKRHGVTVRSVGDGFISYDAHWRRHAVGRSMENHPDYYYGKWAANIYREAHAEGEPRVDDIDVMVKRASEAPRRVRYRRLILPFRAGPGVTWQLGASVVDTRIDLRAEG